MLGRKKRNALIRAFLVAHYPNCFCPPKTIKKPLKIGIFEDIHRAHPEIKIEDLRTALADYASGPRYKVALIDGNPRFDLAGNIVDYVTPEAASRAGEQMWRFPARLVSAVQQAAG